MIYLLNPERKAERESQKSLGARINEIATPIILVHYCPITLAYTLHVSHKARRK